MIGIYPHTVTIEPVATRNAYGEPATYGTALTPGCMVLPGKRKIVTAKGEEVVSRGRAICHGPLTIAEDSVITLQAAFTGFEARMVVLDVSHYVDPETFALDVVEVSF